MLDEDEERSSGEDVAVGSVEYPAMARNDGPRVLHSGLSLQPRFEQITKEGEGEDNDSQDGCAEMGTGTGERGGIGRRIREEDIMRSAAN